MGGSESIPANRNSIPRHTEVFVLLPMAMYGPHCPSDPGVCVWPSLPFRLCVCFAVRMCRCVPWRVVVRRP